MVEQDFKSLCKDIRKCRVCEVHLPHGPRPIFNVSPNSKIVIIGQAPGRRVHESGIPWDDPSGVNLRNWMGIEPEVFYDPEFIGILPMGFCYPGKGSSGDLPPRPECAPLWHDQLLSYILKPALTLVIGQYAQKRVLGKLAQSSLTKTVRAYREYLPNHFPLPHPSPRNNIWKKKNPWFDREVIPTLKVAVQQALNTDSPPFS